MRRRFHKEQYVILTDLGWYTGSTTEFSKNLYDAKVYIAPYTGGNDARYLESLDTIKEVTVHYIRT